MASAIINTGLKELIKRPRPYTVDGVEHHLDMKHKGIHFQVVMRKLLGGFWDIHFMIYLKNKMDMVEMGSPFHCDCCTIIKSVFGTTLSI